MKKQELPELRTNNVFTRTNCIQTGLSFKASVIIFEKNGYLVYPDVAIKKPITISEETLNEFEDVLDYMLCEGYERMRQWKKEKEKQNSSLPF